ncbi:hypothetical protein [Microbacterium terricola]|uniref:Uncharacterized protein n=1 Tax=Microbacterium terricola TaxID=344163 RepID=A0ABM8E369_9MICO|nr:hypothetical protein [Microbacterium terricola]UYK40097.1 hypothetical protein OAU46_00155 [Microbacterium terricola]BDV32202.1 hypothetical protein Microterr_28620 [Microbacterium terricola]
MPARILISAAVAALALASAFVLAAPAASDVATDPPGDHSRVDGDSTPDAASPQDVASGGHTTSFVPIAPCRLVDTANATAGNLKSDARRDFRVSGTAGFSAQGGKSTGCGIPASATAITASVTATKVTTSGSLGVWARGTAAPNTTALLVTKGSASLDSQTVAVTASGISVQPRGARMRLVIDATGYYEPAIYGVFGAEGNAYASSRLSLYSAGGSGDYTLLADSNISSCAVLVSSWGGYQGSGYGSGTFAYVTITSQTGAPVNAYFQASIVC